MRFTAANFLVFFALPLNMNSVTMTISLKETTHHDLLRDEESEWKISLSYDVTTTRVHVTRDTARQRLFHLFDMTDDPFPLSLSNYP